MTYKTWKIIDGKRFASYGGTHATKRDAIKLANKLRDQGLSARVVQRGAKFKKPYIVYSHGGFPKPNTK